MLENSVEKSDNELNNVQKHVEPEELDEGTKTDNVQMDTEECVIGEVTEGVVNNMQKSKPSEENETEENEKDNDLDKLQNSASYENQAEDKKQDDPLENEQPINAANDITEEKTGQHEEQNANAEDMQVEQQSGNDDKYIEESQEDRKDHKVNDDQQDDIDEQTKADNVQKDSDKPKRWISPCSTNAGKAANKLVQNARSKIKGSCKFVNKQRAERAKTTKCFVCGKQNKTLQELELHVHRKHRSYHYKCTYCRKKYLTRAGHNKHEMYHTIGYRYKCKKCKKCFMFESQYDEHMSVHTRDNRYICQKKGCKKDYGSTRARNYHERQHAAKAIYCDFHDNPKAKKCNQEFYSKQHLNQHYQGAHGEGWHSKCGKHFSWPTQWTVHEKDCTECGKIKKQEAKKKWQKKK